MIWLPGCVMRDLAGECNPDEQRRYGLAATLLGQKAAETTHWRPATLAQPEPEDPTNKQAQELFQALRVPIYATRSPGMAEQIVGHEPVNPGDFARAVLTRFARPTIELVAVAERPWEREGWCNSDNEAFFFDSDTKKWSLCECDKYSPVMTNASDRYTHSLPHHALPLPQRSH